MFDGTPKQAVMLSGVNTLGLVSLLGYTLRTFNEMNATLEELRADMEQIKGTFTENNKRSNLAFNKLNQKIEESSHHMLAQNNDFLKKVKKLNLGGGSSKRVEEEEEEIEEITPQRMRTNVERVDDISSAIDELMGGRP